MGGGRPKHARGRLADRIPHHRLQGRLDPDRGSDAARQEQRGREKISAERAQTLCRRLLGRRQQGRELRQWRHPHLRTVRGPTTMRSGHRPRACSAPVETTAAQTHFRVLRDVGAWRKAKTSYRGRWCVAMLKQVIVAVEGSAPHRSQVTALRTRSASGGRTHRGGGMPSGTQLATSRAATATAQASSTSSPWLRFQYAHRPTIGRCPRSLFPPSRSVRRRSNPCPGLLRRHGLPLCSGAGNTSSGWSFSNIALLIGRAGTCPPP